MKKTIIALMLLAAMLIAANICVAETEAEPETEYPWVEVSKAYSPFMYSDSLLMVDENQLDPDIAKISMSLAWLAYEEDDSRAALEQMGYDVLLQWNYDYPYTKSDCHHVAYNIARKQAGDYMIYCVTIRGTRAKLEWTSDFMAESVVDGDVVYYRPFRDASREIEEDLLASFQLDGCSPDKRIIWLTGHSRGAAVANILAGRLTPGNYGRVFGYNFACPAVYLGNAPAYNNIHNFNLVNDFVARVPLTAWGYTRYGKDITADCARWYDSVALSKESMDAAIGYIASYGPDSEIFKTVFALIDWGLNGSKKDTLLETLGYYLLDPDGLYHVVKNGIYSQEESDQLKDECQTMLDFWNTNRQTLVSLSPEEWNEYRSESENADVFALYDSVAGKTIGSYAELEGIISTISGRYEAASNVDSLKGVLDSLFDEEFVLIDGVYVAHMMDTYTRWMNEDYFGYRGMMGRSLNSEDLDINTKTISPQCFFGVDGGMIVNLDNVQAIGEKAFVKCSALSEITIPETLEYIGAYAFEDCENLVKVTIPCDAAYKDFFEGCPVEELTYTPGKTGVVPDRDSYAMATDWMLEYDVRNTLKTLVFEEGITHIGSNLLYYDGNAVSGSGHSTTPAMCGAYLENVTIPSTLKSIGDRSFMGCAILNRVELPEGLESIGKSSFASSGLVEIDFPSTLTAIPDGAFANCGLLTQVVIPETITSVGINAFGDCKSLWKLTLPASTSYNDSFEGSPVETIVYTPGSTGVIADRTKITNYAGQWYISKHMPELDVRESLKEIIFEEGITHIGDYLCCNQEYTAQGYNISEGCTRLERISLPSTLKSIGNNSFRSCVSLSDVEFSVGLERIGEYCFSSCALLPDLVLPDSLSNIGQHCFSGCASMMSVNIPISLEAIPNDAFNGTGLTEVTIPGNVTSVGNMAFGNCWNLKKITLSADISSYNDSFEGSPVETIIYTPGSTGVIADRTKKTDYYGSYRYSSNMPELDAKDSLKEIIFEEGITYIGAYLCYNEWYSNGTGFNGSDSCTKLERISLPSTLKNIGKYSFRGCSALAEAALPEGLTSIGEYAFQNCDTLSDIVLPDTLASLGAYSFASSSIQFRTSLPSALESIPDYAFSGSSELTEVIIPDNVASVGYKAFGNCPNLKKITLSANISSYSDSFEGSPVETIIYTPGSTGVIADRTKKTDYYGSYHYSSNMPELDAKDSLKEIIFEEGITYIGAYLCYNEWYSNGTGFNGSDSCTKLERIVLPSSLQSIGNYSFKDCSALSSANFPAGLETIGGYSFSGCTVLSGIVLPDSISSMGNHCFSGCTSMTSVNIPAALTEITNNAFNGSGITEITIPAHVTSVGGGAFGNCRSLKKLTLAANVSNYKDSFENSPVETIVYTPGSTGVIADRTKKTDYYGSYHYSSNMPELDAKDSLKEIIFEEGITYIGAYLCYNKWYSNGTGFNGSDSCTKLERIVLPSTMQGIGNYSFASCNQLTDITFLSSADAELTINGSAFQVNGPLTTYIRVPNASEVNPSISGYNWTGNGRNAIFTVKLDGPFEIADVSGEIGIEVPLALSVVSIPQGYGTDDLVWSVDDDTIARVSTEGELTFSRAGYITVSVMIPETGLYDDLLLECVGTKIIQLPAMLTQVRQEAFTSIPAEIVIIPETVQLVETDAFASCPNLYKVILRNPNTVIAEGAFGSNVTVIVEEEALASAS